MMRSSILRKVVNPILQYSASANLYSRNAQTLNIPKDLQSYMTRISPFKGFPGCWKQRDAARNHNPCIRAPTRRAGLALSCAGVRKTGPLKGGVGVAKRFRDVQCLGAFCFMETPLWLLQWSLPEFIGCQIMGLFLEAPA